MNLFGTLNIVLHSQTNSEIKDLYRLLVLCQRATRKCEVDCSLPSPATTGAAPPSPPLQLPSPWLPPPREEKEESPMTAGASPPRDDDDDMGRHMRKQL